MSIEAMYRDFLLQSGYVEGLELEGCDLDVWLREVQALEKMGRGLLNSGPSGEREHGMIMDVAKRRMRRTQAEFEAIREDTAHLVDCETVIPGVQVGSTWHSDTPYRRPIAQPEPSPVTVSTAPADPEPSPAATSARPSLLRRMVNRMMALAGPLKPA